MAIAQAYLVGRIESHVRLRATTPSPRSALPTRKENLVHRQSLPTRDAASRAIVEFIEVFLQQARLHSTLGNLTPAQYRDIQLDAHSGRVNSERCGQVDHVTLLHERHRLARIPFAPLLEGRA